MEPQLAKGVPIVFGKDIINNYYIDDSTGQLYVDLQKALNAYNTKTGVMKFTGSGNSKSIYLELYSPKETKVVRIYKPPYTNTIDVYQFILEYNASNESYGYNYYKRPSSTVYFKGNQALVNVEYFKRLLACLTTEAEISPQIQIPDALKSTLNQIFAGRYADDATLLGTAGEIGVGFIPLNGNVQSGRDFVYDLQHWDWSLGYAGQTALDALE